MAGVLSEYLAKCHAGQSDFKMASKIRQWPCFCVYKTEIFPFLNNPNNLDTLKEITSQTDYSKSICLQKRMFF